jgi:cytochrome b
VAAIILMRLAWALTGVPQLGLMRFYPHFAGLRLSTAMTHPATSRTLLAGTAACLIAVTVTGIAIDQGHSIGFAEHVVTRPALAESDAGRVREARDHDIGESPLGEVHEVLANLLVLLIFTHVAYLLFFKRPLAQFMLFLDTRKQKDEAA